MRPLFWEHGAEKIKEFIEHLNEKYPTIKFTAEWYHTFTNFFAITVSLIDGILTTDLYFKPTDSHKYPHSTSRQPYHCKREFHKVTLFLIEFFQVLILLIGHSTILKRS